MTASIGRQVKVYVIIMSAQETGGHVRLIIAQYMKREAKVKHLENGKVKEYIKRYCRKHKCTYEEAKTHAMVKNVMEYYEHVNDGKISVSEIKAGCGAASGGDCK